MADPIRAIFETNLQWRPGERVLVFTDSVPPGALGPAAVLRKRRDISCLAAEIVGRYRRAYNLDFLSFPGLGQHGLEPPERLWRLACGDEGVDGLAAAGLLGGLLAKRLSTTRLRRAERILARRGYCPYSSVLALSWFSSSHTRFRELLCRLWGVRYASLPLFERKMLGGAMRADWREVRRLNERLARAMRGAGRAELTAPNGSRLSFSLAGREARLDSGILERGGFGNLPAGEVFFAPREGTARGTLVLDYGTERAFRRPLELDFSAGRVTRLRGGDGWGEELAALIKRRPCVAWLAELGIGTNPRASDKYNVLEAEKIMGTVHFALGDNSSFGGRLRCNFHQDYIVERPTLVVRLARGGRRTIISAGVFAV